MIKKTHTFSVNYFSPSEDKTYEGQFTVKLTTFVDKTKIATRKSQLLGGMYCVRDEEGLPNGRGVDETTEWHAYMMAYLEVTLIQKPTWWLFEGADAILDDEVIFIVMKEAMAFENSFRSRKRPSAQGTNGSLPSGEGTGAPQPAQANAGNPAPQVVDREVQAALEP
jgi:hypothetical protein